jgi:S-DNA-T family DNA segregation ATPase FtsK/SpoIIIE
VRIDRLPGKSTVGIEVPNIRRETIFLREIIESVEFQSSQSKLTMALGKDIVGKIAIADLAKMPHLLIAGQTGAGKSVAVNAMIISILYKASPEDVKFIMVDPKRLELGLYEDIPHLLTPVVTEPKRASNALKWAVNEMESRYKLLATVGVRNIEQYNAFLKKPKTLELFPKENGEERKPLPFIVIVIDELADLMMTSGKEVEAHIVRIAQKARAVGIHLILATQRPQANVVTGLIKANMPSKIAFRVNTRMDSRIVLDQNGADLLLGQGDMLFLPPGMGKPIRAQGTYIDDKEIRESVRLCKDQADAQFEPELVQIRTEFSADDIDKDDLFDDAVKIILETKRGSVSLLQRRLTIGYSRASRLIEMMAGAGIVGAYKGSQAREALLTLEEWEALKAARVKDKADGMSV